MVLKALILVGGHGTRLRPLTFTKSKPLVDFVNRPMVFHQIEALSLAGVMHIILAVSYKQKELEEVLKEFALKLDIKIDFSVENEPLGTAGPICLAKELLDQEDEEPFFMLNADISCCYPFSELLQFHRAHGKEGSIVVTRVDDPSKYGVVVEHPHSGGRIKQFVEKPVASKTGETGFLGDKINAGIYIFNKGIIDRIQPVKTSIERQIFPCMAAEGKLFMMTLKGYWMDIGQPKDYLVGQALHLEDLRASESESLSTSHRMKTVTFGGGVNDFKVTDEVSAVTEVSSGIKCRIIGNVVIDPLARITSSCLLGPNVVIGPHVIIGNATRVQHSAIFSGTKIGDGTFIANSIIGWNCCIGNWCRLEDNCVLGEDVDVKDCIFLKGTRVCPHKIIKESNYSSGHVVL